MGRRGGWRALAAGALIALLLPACGASAATYYVSGSDGDDARSAAQAQSLSTPWKTIQKAASTMASGDICLIRAGTYRETVTPGAGQTFQNYNGEYVLISGCDVVPPGGWTQHSGNIYKVTVSSKVYDVFVDGAYMDKAQYPNANSNRNDQVEWALTTASFVDSATTRVTVNGMNVAPGFWNGGWYSGINGINCYAGTLGNIVGSSGDTLTLCHIEYRQNYSNTHHLGAGKGYIINHLNCLDVAKEWHWESNTLYLYAPGGGSPSPRVVEARVRLYGFNVGVNNVTIRGLNFKGAAARLAGNNCTVDGCTFRYVSPWGNYKYPPGGTEAGFYIYGGTNDGMSGIHISGSANTFKNNYVAHGWGALVSCRGSRNTIDNNRIEDSNWATRGWTVNISFCGRGQKISRNTVRHSNAMLIANMDTDANDNFQAAVVSNDCRYWGFVNPDGGAAAIYRNGSNNSEGDLYAYNLIAFGMGSGAMGIYLDDGSQNLTVHHNAICVNNSGVYVRGIFFHGNSVAQANIYAYNNTCCGLFGTTHNQAIFAYNTGASYTDIVYKNNLASVNAFVNGTTVQANSGSATSNCFVDAANVNFRLTAGATAAIDQGVVISGFTGGYLGGAPDIGAYERNGPDWTAGSNVAVPNFPDEGSVPAPTASSGL